MTKYMKLGNTRFNRRPEKKGDDEGCIGYPPFVYFLFSFFSLYLVLPLVEVPFLGLSISAPVFFLIALETFFRPPQPWLGKYVKWGVLSVSLWLGLFLAAMLSGLQSGGIRLDTDTWIALLRYAYWFLVFFVSVYLLSSQKKMADRVAVLIAVGIALLGALRLGEALLGGATGAWMRLRLMSQNGYAMQFSMFFPVLLSFVYMEKKRNLAIFATILLVSAMLINGSRSNWIASAVALVVFLFLLFQAQKKFAKTVFILFVLAILVGVVALLAPQPVVDAFQQRFSTLDRLEQDKSYAIRQLMVQKGVRLFQSSPWFGVGISRWRKEIIALDLPRILSYAPQAHFDVKSSHNSYISYLAESGLVGTAPLALLLLILTVFGYRAAIVLASDGKIWAIGVYAGFIGMSIHLWTLSGLTGTAPWFVYALVAAVIVIGRAQTKEKKEKHASRLSLSRPRIS